MARLTVIIFPYVLLVLIHKSYANSLDLVRRNSIYEPLTPCTMALLYVHRNRTVKVDVSSLIKYARYHWRADNDGTVYRMGREGKITLEFCVKVDRGIDPLAEVKYVDGDRHNLTLSNIQGIPYKLGPNFSPYTGVSFDTSRGKWLAQLTHNGRRVLFKRCTSETEALTHVNKTRIHLGLEPIKPIE